MTVLPSQVATGLLTAGMAFSFQRLVWAPSVWPPSSSSSSSTC